MGVNYLSDLYSKEESTNKTMVNIIDPEKNSSIHDPGLLEVVITWKSSPPIV